MCHVPGLLSLVTVQGPRSLHADLLEYVCTQARSQQDKVIEKIVRKPKYAMNSAICAVKIAFIP